MFIQTTALAATRLGVELLWGSKRQKWAIILMTVGQQASLLSGLNILGKSRTWCQKYTQNFTSEYWIKPASYGIYKCMCM